MKTMHSLIAICVLAACTTNAPFSDPMDNAALRATPLHFGLKVTPDPSNNPITPPERFSGYHVAVDYEVSEDELDIDIPVYAICPGKVRFSGYAEGYGGLLVQECKLDGNPVTVLYGHLVIDGLPAENSKLNQREILGYLGAANSYDSGYTRKHLHLGIHKGSALDIRGYVQTAAEVNDFIDPSTVLPSFAVDLPLEQGGEVPYWQMSGSGSSSSPAPNE